MQRTSRPVPGWSGRHRPYPAPLSPWIMRQTWSELLFAHWPLPADDLRPLLPAGLPLDTFDGQGWVGVVPFRMSDVAPRGIPAVPWLSAFPELNVRTYVTLGGRPGVWFFSLDAGNPIAVRTARTWFRLPYFNARMRISRAGSDAGGTLDGEPAGCRPEARASVRTAHGAALSNPPPRPGRSTAAPPGDHGSSLIRYSSARSDHSAPPAVLQATYAPTGPVVYPEQGSLADWLTARYCFYTADRRGRLLRAEIDHAPWPLQAARATIRANSMAAAAGIDLPDEALLLHYVESIDVRVWPVRRVRSSSR